MGLGKTVQSLAIADYYKDEWPMFIIVPSSVKFMWKENIERWLHDTLAKYCAGRPFDECIQVLESGRQAIDKRSLVVVCSYDLLSKNVDEIAANSYKVIIVDESHLLKNMKAARTKAALALIKNCKRVILLSGTAVFCFFFYYFLIRLFYF
jgi:SWI/SNF-related matrix-associated actin-dependent regulator of chromatin subfamily A-like protein 1